MICAPSVGEEQAAKFEKVYYNVRYIFNEEKIENKIVLICPPKHSHNNFCVLNMNW